MVTKKMPNEFVLDCSITMAWCFEDESTAFTEFVLDGLQDSSAKVPNLWPLEVANVLLIAERKKRLSFFQAVNFKSSLEALPIIIDPLTSSRAFETIFELAREYKLTSYDAAYLELAWREKLPLCTLDAALKKTAQTIGVKLLTDK